ARSAEFTTQDPAASSSSHSALRAPHSALRAPHSALEVFRASDGYRFYYRHFPAAGAPKARLVFVHGIRSHGGWYTRSCAAFAAAGFDVTFLDRRGAGLNTTRRGDCPGFRRLLDDVAEFVQNLRAE